jgi:hypothetical protein
MCKPSAGSSFCSHHHGYLSIMYARRAAAVRNCTNSTCMPPCPRGVCWGLAHNQHSHTALHHCSKQPPTSSQSMAAPGSRQPPQHHHQPAEYICACIFTLYAPWHHDLQQWARSTAMPHHRLPPQDWHRDGLRLPQRSLAL